MTLGIIDVNSGITTDQTPNTNPDVYLKNILIELRVITSILLAENNGQSVIETADQLRLDQVTEFPKPII